MKFEMNDYFKAGIFCFALVGLFNFIVLAGMYKTMAFFAVLSSLVSIFFNFVTAYFFYYLLKQMPSTTPGESINVAELEQEFLKK